MVSILLSEGQELIRVLTDSRTNIDKHETARHASEILGRQRVLPKKATRMSLSSDRSGEVEEGRVGSE